MTPPSKAFIYFINNRPAAYTQKKAKSHINKEGSKDFINRLDKTWQSSFLAYMKEPGFKVGEIIYCDGKKWELTEIHDKGYNLKRDNRITNGKMSFKIAQLEDLSHFHPGQQIDLSKFKYVREPGLNKDENNELLSWIEIEEGEPHLLSDVGYDRLKELREKQAEWQEVKEPEETIQDHYVDSNDEPQMEWERNPKYDLFQADKQSGKVLLTPEG